jgi:mono/diheme cytochrome c family protein
MVPSLNHPDTLAVASDAYLRSIVAFGRENTNMLGWGLTADGGLRDEEIDGIVDYIRSWTRPGPDLGAVSASRGNSRHGRAIFQQNCAACHGQRGEGGIGVSLNSPTFLGVASDRFLATTIAEGRPDTAMPGWRQFDTQQVSDLLAYLRTWQPRQNDLQTVLGLTSSTPDERRAARVSADVGETLYKANCVTCHGPDGEGDLGPSLSTQEFLTVISDEYLYETLASGRPGTGMPAWRHLSSEDVASLILFIRTWQSHTARTLPTTPVVGDWDTGRFLFEGTCAGCHGNDAEGGVGPQLSNPVFLRTASDAMLRRWIAYGKTGTPMRAFLKGGQGTVELLPRQIDDLVAYLRSLERDRRVSIAKRPSGRPELGRLWYAVSCASCHGERGEGASGPALANRRFLGAASDGFLMATMAMGRDGTEMRPVKKSAQSILSLTSDQVNDVVAYLRSWEYNPPQQGVVHRYVVPWDLARGRILYESHCAGCHGIDGKGEIEEPGQLSAWAPNLNNKGFLAAATDGFLQATIVRGRSGTAMRPFGHGAQGLVDLTSDDIDDLVAYIRRWSAEPGLPITIPAEIETTTDSTTEVPKQHETARRHETSAGDVHAPPRSSNAVGVALNLKEGD